MFKLHFSPILLYLVAISHAYYTSYSQWEFMFPIHVMDQLFAIESNDSLSQFGKDQAIDSVICKNVHYSQRNHLQLPSVFAGLPEVSKWQIKDVLYHPNISYSEKQTIISNLIAQLPPDQQVLPPKDRCFSESSKPKSMYFDSYSSITYTIKYTVPLNELMEKLPVESFTRVAETLENKTLTAEQKLNDITYILTYLDSDVQQTLFQMNGPMDIKPFHKNVLSQFLKEDLNRSLPTMPSFTPPSSLPPTRSNLLSSVFGTNHRPNITKLKELLG